MTGRPNIYAGPYLDRTAALREHDRWRPALGEGRALLIPVWRSRNLVLRLANPPAARLLEWREAMHLVDNEGELVLLGEFRERLCFALELQGEEPPAVDDAAEFADLRAVGGSLPHDEAGLLAYARAMVLWRSRHRFCGTCGAPTTSSRAGHVLRCSVCEAQHFPRIDPAIIVLVSKGAGPSESALLGRQTAWPPGRYSTIAGFVEPGESLEDAVAREVREEAGVETAEITYHSSQPWPFPSSLMLGFRARASSTAIRLNDGELEDARWFTRDDLASGRVLLPPAASISFRLIDEWRREGGQDSG